MTDDRPATPTVEDALMRSATDQAFRERLLADPGAALAEMGLELPAEGFVVPPLADGGADADAELSDDALAGITGGHMGPPLWQLTHGPSPWDP